MAWVEPFYTRNQVNWAGEVLLNMRKRKYNYDDVEEAFIILNNWRASHSFPLNTFQMRLRSASSKITSNYLIAQRLKRVPSIVMKLSRFPKMKLSRMQDIGGCRSVLDNLDQVRSLQTDYMKSRIRSKKANEKDYISNPKESGYRGIHLVYKYRSDSNRTYDDLQIEIQIRTKLQHTWATAVETMGTFLKTSLKSSEGPEEWLRFFSLMGSAFAFEEETSPIPHTPNNEKELIRQIRQHAKRLKVKRKLDAFSSALKITEDKSRRQFRYYLLFLNPMSEILEIRGYKKDELEKAANEYTNMERRIESIRGAESVLVSVDSLKELRFAYPNYFLDTSPDVPPISTT